MQYFQDRAERRQAALSFEEQKKHYERILPYLEHLDEQDERTFAGGRTTRSSANAQKRGIERLFKLEAESYEVGHFTKEEIQAFFDEHGMTIAEMRNKMWADVIDDYYKHNKPATEPTIQIDAENRRDIRDNFLYETWVEQLGKHNSIRTYPTYALFTAIKSAVEAISRGAKEEDLRKIHQGPLPDRQQIIYFKQDPDYDVNNLSQHFGLCGNVPGVLELAESMMLHYSDYVRAERSLDTTQDDVVPSPLPDDPGTTSLESRYELPEYVRTESAIQAYVADEGSVRVLAERYNVGRDRLFKVLKSRGLLRPVGGDRRKG